MATKETMDTVPVLLNSGGMDTFLLAHHLAQTRSVAAQHVFVDIGQSYAAKEREAATHIANCFGAAIHYVKGGNLASFEHPSGIIPFRNAHLIMHAAQYGDHIYLGVVQDEINSDKSPEFFRAMEKVLDISHRKQYWTQGREFMIHTPMRWKSKANLVHDYLRDGGFMAPLLRTVSCYNGTERHCGKCSSCFKRWVALALNGVMTWQEAEEHFERHPVLWKPASEWRVLVKGYSPKRADEVIRALETAGIAL